MPKKKRDDFSEDVKDTLARRAGMKCSNPQCRIPTTGPRTDPTKAVSVGVAAHIRAAQENGPRYELHMSSAERSDITNGIWLCQTHAKLIDNDPDRYTVSLLKSWKDEAEKAALAELEATALGATAISTVTAHIGVHTESVRLRLPIGPKEQNGLPVRPVGSEADMANAAIRMAVAARRGETVRVDVHIPELAQIKPSPDGKAGRLDAVALAQTQRDLANITERMRFCIETLFSQAAVHAWGNWLTNNLDVAAAYRAVLCGRETVGVGITIWREEAPELTGVIYVREVPVIPQIDEVTHLLERIEEPSIDSIHFGGHTADRLPKNVIVNRVIPRILEAVSFAPEIATLPNLSEVLDLASWRIGAN